MRKVPNAPRVNFCVILGAWPVRLKLSLSAADQLNSLWEDWWPVAMEDVFARCVREFNTESVRQRLDRRHSAFKHVRAFLSDRSKIVASTACVVKCAPVLPRLSSGPSDEAPRISSAVKICFQPQLGRHLVAERDIQPGNFFNSLRYNWFFLITSVWKL